jgi:nicotinate-nucleotide adenylyltransferase
VGHLVAAVDCLEQLPLDVVLLVVANEPWQKVATRSVTPAADRLAMVAAAVEGVPGLEVSDVELRRGGASYTVDTLEELLAAEPDAELHLVLGADAAAGLDTWHRWQDLADLAAVVVVERPGAATRVPPGFRVRRVRATRLDVSSTDLRRRAAEGRSLRFLVPDGAVEVIHERGLYGVRR